MRHRLALPFVVLAALVVGLAGIPRARAAEPEVLADRWDLVRMNEKPAGHVHTFVRRAGTAEAPLIETTVTSHIEVRVGPDRRVTDEVAVTRERSDGALVALQVRKTEAGQESLVEVTFSGAKAVVATTEVGQRRESSVPIPQGTVGPWRMERIPLEAGLKAGGTHRIPTYLNDFGGPVTLDVTVGGKEEVETLAGRQSLVRVDVKIGPLPPMATWLAADGATLLSRLEMPGMKVELLRGTEEQVRAATAGEEAPPDIFTASLVKTRHLVPHARTSEHALFAIRPHRAGGKVPPLEDARQTIESRAEDGAVLLRVRRVVPPAGKTGKRPLASPPADLAPYLASTSMVQTDDPLIQKTAVEAAGTETDAWKAAQAVERWVHRAIDDKNFGVSFASALQVCKDRSGDCTEHAVLMTALCRALGIPARVVFGLEYLSGILGGHAWTEVWVDGAWYALDATLGTGAADALHLAFGRLALAEGTYGQEMMAAAVAMKEVEVDLREVGRQGRTLRLDREDAVVVDGSRYVNRLWGLALEAPAGFDVKAREPFKGMSERLLDLRGKTDGGKRKVKVRASALLPGQTLESVLPKDAKLTATTIDGRPARIGDVKDGKDLSRFAFVLDDEDSLFSFELEPAEGAADAALLDALLATVDLDVETTVPAPPK